MAKSYQWFTHILSFSVSLCFPHFNLLLHSCRFSLIHVSLSLFPCWLSHGINNTGLSGCQDNSIGLHRDHMNGNVDWTRVTSRLVIANRNNSGAHECVKDQPSESRNGTKKKRKMQYWTKVELRESVKEEAFIFSVESLSQCRVNWDPHPPKKNKTQSTFFSFPHQNRHKVVTNQSAFVGLLKADLSLVDLLQPKPNNQETTYLTKNRSMLCNTA